MKALVVAIFAAVVLAAATWPSVGLVYDSESRTLLRIILPDHNWELYEQPLQPSETILIVPVLWFGDTRACGKRVDLYACRRLVEAAQ